MVDLGCKRGTWRTASIGGPLTGCAQCSPWERSTRWQPPPAWKALLTRIGCCRCRVPSQQCCLRVGSVGGRRRWLRWKQVQAGGVLCRRCRPHWRHAFCCRDDTLSAGMLQQAAPRPKRRPRPASPPTRCPGWQGGVECLVGARSATGQQLARPRLHGRVGLARRVALDGHLPRQLQGREGAAAAQALEGWSGDDSNGHARAAGQHCGGPAAADPGAAHGVRARCLPRASQGSSASAERPHAH